MGARQRAILASVVLLVVVAALVAVLLAVTAAGQSPDVLAVQRISLDALHAEHELATLPASAAQTGVTASLRGQLVATAQSTIDRIYAGPLHDSRIDTIIGAIEAEGTSSGMLVWNGGVHDVAYKSTSVSGSSATVVIQAVTFVEMSVTATDDHSRPEAGATYTFGLTKTGGRWFVTDEHVEFLPGQGP